MRGVKFVLTQSFYMSNMSTLQTAKSGSKHTQSSILMQQNILIKKLLDAFALAEFSMVDLILAM